MKQETADQLATADRSLANALQMMTLPLHNEAGRAAYYAMFHAAQALVVERGMVAAKTHRGLRQLFARVAHTEAADVQAFVPTLTNAYRMKWINDYDTSGTTLTAPETTAAIDDARDFVAIVRRTLTPPTP